ncbi:MAG: hypothetical protein HZA93_01850 [Verrucomicrobia bacterium]|nr:hypothetical protein [Verrucomicrobiota bacterium]
MNGRKKAQAIILAAALARAPIGARTASFASGFLALLAAKKSLQIGAGLALSGSSISTT